MTKRSHEEMDDLYRFSLKRMICIEHSNIWNTAHGGSLFSMMDEACSALVTRYCNESQERTAEASPSLVRVEKTEFLKPINIGTFVNVEAKLLFTSKHSLLVSVEVFAADYKKGVNNKLTNKALLWYVPIDLNDARSILPVPQMTFSSKEEEETGLKYYEKHKSERANTISDNQMETTNVEGTVSGSKTELGMLINNYDLHEHGICRGGVLVKLMDECAGVVAYKHAKKMVVTSKLEKINFKKPLIRGGVITATGQALSTGKCSIQVQVRVYYEVPWLPNSRTECVAEGSVTFVSIDDMKKPCLMPQLNSSKDEEKTNFKNGQKELGIDNWANGSKRTKFE